MKKQEMILNLKDEVEYLEKRYFEVLNDYVKDLNREKEHIVDLINSKESAYKRISSFQNKYIEKINELEHQLASAYDKIETLEMLED